MRVKDAKTTVMVKTYTFVCSYTSAIVIIATLIINNLGVSINLLRTIKLFSQDHFCLKFLHTILSDAEACTSRSKDGVISVNLNWRCLIAFECLQIVISNPGLSELFANSSLSIGAPVLIQILECYI